MPKELILAICAHNDDQIIGAGGTLAKYAKEGKRFKTIIFSFGESSHPHLRPEVVVQTRMDESVQADKILGGDGIAYFGIPERNFPEYFKKKNIKHKIKFLIEHAKPSKIFTHSENDFHPDHKAVNRLVVEVIQELKIDCDVYTFEVWNIVKTKNRNLPKLVVDITDTFQTKLNALKAHKSQQATIISLLWNIYLKALFNGWRNRCRYAEVFDKIN